MADDEDLLTHLERELTRPSLADDAAILFLGFVIGLLLGGLLAFVIGP